MRRKEPWEKQQIKRQYLAHILSGSQSYSHGKSAIRLLGKHNKRAIQLENLSISNMRNRAGSDDEALVLFHIKFDNG